MPSGAERGIVWHGGRAPDCQNPAMTRRPFCRPTIAPALFLSAALLQGCSILSPQKTDDAAGADPASPLAEAQAESRLAPGTFAFTVAVRSSDETVRDYLSTHLELQRYRRLDDLDLQELSRLMAAADGNARELLGTLGYFAPTLSLELVETPDRKEAPREVVVTVEPGQRTRIAGVKIDFAGDIAAAPEGSPAAAQRASVRNAWGLRSGQNFTQNAWSGAKTAGLRGITAQRYPTGRIAASKAEVDADRDTAQLSVIYDSGPTYRFGPLKVEGTERYSPETARRLARLPTGAEYSQQRLLDAQQRLASSGYFDSVFLTLDPNAPDPLAAPVTAQVREARLQKVVLGVGFSTDSGPRLTADHIHNQVPGIGWRAVSKVLVDQKTKVLGSELTSLPDEENWRWVVGGQLRRELTGSYEVNSGQLRGGRSKLGDRIDRNYFLQYDYATSQGVGAPPSASALSANWGWTGRYFDNVTAPTRGYGLATEVGVGHTLTNNRAPFLRNRTRVLGFVPLGDVAAPDGSAARASRLKLRGEVGAVVTRADADVPSTLLFLTGGDTTVRGYGYRRIGARIDNGQLYAGRYLAVASAEWLRPVVWKGEMTEFESAVFVDVGSVADRVADMQARVGVGAGVRWRSPVGPVAVDVAYGVQAKAVRLHLSLGFTF